MKITDPRKINIRKLRKAEIITLWEELFHGRCKHGATYAEHMACWKIERPDGFILDERIGFLDIEATSLNASFGYMLSWCIKDEGGKIHHDLVRKREITRDYTFDKRIVTNLCKKMFDYDRIVVYYGGDAKYDLPFIRTRAILYDIEFPQYLAIYCTDVYTIVKQKLRLHRSRLETACQFFGIPAKGHRLDPNIWHKAQGGHKESLEWILEHNKEDVVSLELLYNKLISQYRDSKSSI